MPAQRRGGHSRLPTRTTTSHAQGVRERASASPPLPLTLVWRGGPSDELIHACRILQDCSGPSHGLTPLECAFAGSRFTLIVAAPIHCHPGPGTSPLVPRAAS